MKDVTEISRPAHASVQVDVVRASRDYRFCELVSGIVAELAIVRFPIFARRIVTVNRFREGLRWPGGASSRALPSMFYFHVLRNVGENGRTLSREAPPSGKKHGARADTEIAKGHGSFGPAVGSYDKSSDATRERCTKLRATRPRTRRVDSRRHPTINDLRSRGRFIIA